MSFPSIGIAGHEVAEVRFENPISTRDVLAALQRLNSGEAVDANLPGQPALPWIPAVIPGVGESGMSNWDVVALAAETLAVQDVIPPSQADISTGDTSLPAPLTPPDTRVYSTDDWYPHLGVVVFQQGSLRGTSAASVAWCPFRYNPVRRELVVIRRAVITAFPVGTTAPPLEPADTIQALDDVKDLVVPSLQRLGPEQSMRAPGPAGGPTWVLSPAPPLGISYVIITKEQFVDQMRPLALWKARRGIAAGIAAVENIAARYPAVDTAASIREYLKDAYSSGLMWVVLAGDQGVVPIRYAYAGYQTAPADLRQFQICDLYYADLDGDWDANGNGVWGEYFGDKPDLYAELFVGRLPFSQRSEAETVVRKIIAYESGPADASYLTRTLSVAADQMRDWSGGEGQQRLVDSVMPAGWSSDETSMIEEPSGIDPAPVGPDGINFASVLAGGFGWVNYFVHGRSDAFVVRSPGYMNSPRSLVLTSGFDGDGNGHINELPANPYLGIHLSVACEQGAFDYDAPPIGSSTEPCVAEKLLLTPLGGAVAFIGQSRWGWVSSSYKLVSKFYEYIGDTSVPNHIGIYQEMAKIAYPGYRDLNYGNNLYGDPEMPVWKDIPKNMTVHAPATSNPDQGKWAVSVRDGNGPVRGALATVSVGNAVWSLGVTDADGEAGAELALPSQADAILTVSKPGYRVHADTISYGIIADAGDDGTATPKHYTFLSNAPNPFNPSTGVKFSLAKSGHVNIKIYDILGHAVRTLIDAELQAGPHEIEFEGTDQSGQALGSGVYFARLTTDGQSRVRKMVLLR